MLYNPSAGVVELVDARVSKTRSHKECRFDSDHPHQTIRFRPAAVGEGNENASPQSENFVRSLGQHYEAL